MGLNPLISVIVPGYNMDRYVGESLTSLAAQTYKNIEIIFVSDASTDDSLSIAAGLLEQSGVNYRIIDLRTNVGVSAARNAGIKQAAGEYIFFLDSDDFLLPNLIEELYKAAAAACPAADVVLCGYRTLDETTGKKILYPIDKNVTSALSPDVIARKRTLSKISSVVGTLYKKDFLFALGIFFSENCHCGEDGEFAIKALSVSSRTAICHETGYIYRIHDGMGSKKQAAEVKIGRYRDHTEAQARTAKFILRHSRSLRLRKVASSLIIPLVIMRRLSYLAMIKDKRAFDKAFSETDFRLLLKSINFLLEKPEVFVRALFLCVSPNVYYKKYAKRYKRLSARYHTARA